MTDASVKVVRTFSWNSPEEGKLEYDEFHAIFYQTLGSRTYLLSELEVSLAKPIDPGPEVGNAAQRLQWQERKGKYNKALLDLYKDYNHAINCIKNSITLWNCSKRFA